MAAALLIAALWSAAAGAEVLTDDSSVIVRDSHPAQSGSGGSGGSGDSIYRDCVDEVLVLSSFMKGFDRWTGVETDVTTTSNVAWRRCFRVDSGAEVAWATGLFAAPGAEMDPTIALVEQARATIAIAVPDVELSPPHGGTQLVGVPVWVWSNNHRPVSVTASIPTLSATLTATPGDLVVDLGDGARFTCRGGGVRYRRDLPHEAQETDCAEAYERHGRRTLTVSVVWSLSWTATNGQAGTLPPVTRTTSLDLDVQQAQAVTT